MLYDHMQAGCKWGAMITSIISGCAAILSNLILLRYLHKASPLHVNCVSAGLVISFCCVQNLYQIEYNIRFFRPLGLLIFRVYFCNFIAGQVKVSSEPAVVQSVLSICTK